MTQEEKQLLLADICARLPYGFTLYRESDDCIITIKPGDISTFAHFLEYSESEDFKLYLRQMSSMTEEEEEEYNGLLYGICDFTQDSSILTPITDLITFFYSHHLDYRGLIPRGLALEATENMYKID